jgi:membrane-associated phospholipid phosphatase
MEDQPLDFKTSSMTGWVRAARVFSDVVSPPVIFVLLGLVVALSELALLPGLLWGIVFGLLVSGLPMVVVAYLLKTGRASDIHMSNPDERHIPYLIGLLGAVAALLVVLLFNGPPLLQCLALCAVIGLAVLGMINRYWLISNHTASITMAAVFAGFAFGVIYGIALAVFVVLLFAARLYLKRHTVAQLIAGVFVGAASVLVVAAFGCFG